MAINEQLARGGTVLARGSQSTDEPFQLHSQWLA